MFFVWPIPKVHFLRYLPIASPAGTRTRPRTVRQTFCSLAWAAWSTWARPSGARWPLSATPSKAGAGNRTTTGSRSARSREARSASRQPFDGALWCWKIDVYVGVFEVRFEKTINYIWNRNSDVLEKDIKFIIWCDSAVIDDCVQCDQMFW